MDEELMNGETSQTEGTGTTEEETPEFDFTDSTEQTEESQEPEFSLPIKYNGQEETLTREQAIEFAQKGRNYDHVAEELSTLREQLKDYDEIKNSPERQMMEELAHDAGMTVPEYLQAVQEQKKQQEIQQLIDDGVPNQYAQEHLSMRNDAIQTKKELGEVKAELERIKTEQQKTAVWADFFQDHPDISGYEALPDDVKADVSTGTDPRIAYTAYENKQLKAELSALKQNSKNKETAPGSDEGDGHHDQLDAFGAAFVSALKG